MEAETIMTKDETADGDRPVIGWIGAGNLGTPICRNLLNAGNTLHVCDIDPARTAALARLGAAVADDPAAVARASDIVFSAMPSDEALVSIVGGEDGLAAALADDRIYVDVSTVSPGTSSRVAELLAPSGALYLRATISGSTANAESGALGIYCSGPREAYDRCLPVLHAMGDRVSYNGTGEEARILKLLVNIIVIATPAIVGEALAFGRRSGLGWEQMIDAIADSVAASPVVKYKTDCMKDRDWSPMATIDLTAKDLALALEWGREVRVPMPFASLVRQLIAGFQASGDGGKDFFYTLTWPERVTGESGSAKDRDGR